MAISVEPCNNAGIPPSREEPFQKSTVISGWVFINIFDNEYIRATILSGHLTRTTLFPASVSANVSVATVRLRNKIATHVANDLPMATSFGIWKRLSRLQKILDYVEALS